MTPTPAQRRSAWVTLVAQMEGRLVSTRENARAMAKLGADFFHGVPRAEAEDWEATAWACQRLLADLATLLPPAIPEDPALGQATLEEAMAEEDVHWAGESGWMLHAADTNPVSTSGDEEEVTCLRCISELERRARIAASPGAARALVAAGEAGEEEAAELDRLLETPGEQVAERAKGTGRQVHWHDLKHGLHNLTQPPLVTENPLRVTCRRCLHAMGLSR